MLPNPPGDLAPGASRYWYPPTRNGRPVVWSYRHFQVLAVEVALVVDYRPLGSVALVRRISGVSAKGSEDLILGEGAFPTELEATRSLLEELETHRTLLEDRVTMLEAQGDRL